jgi:hypothetical protein
MSPTGGFVKVWRSLAEDPLWTRVPDAWLRVALGMLLKANWKPQKWYDGHRETLIPPGSFVTSIPKMAQFCRVTEKQYRVALGYLVRSGFGAVMRAPLYHIVTIRNWAAYQGGENREGRVEGSPRAGSGQGEGTNRRKKEATLSSSEGKNSKKEALTTRSSYSCSGVVKIPNAPATHPEADGPKSSQTHLIDDDRKKPLPAERQTYASDRDELVALMERKTGETPDRKLLRNIGDFLELRGGTLRQYLDDIAPRLDRLSKKPGLGFFFSHAKTWGGEPQHKAKVTPTDGKLATPQKPSVENCQRCGLKRGRGLILENGRVKDCPECLAYAGALKAATAPAAREVGQ